MNLEKALKEKDCVINELVDRLEACQKRLNHIENVTLKVQKVLKRHDNGNLEVLMITAVHNTPNGIIVEIS